MSKSKKYIPPKSKRVNFLMSDESYRYRDLATNDKLWTSLWKISSDDIKATITNYIREFDELLDKICNMPESKQTYENTIMQIDEFGVRNHFDVYRMIFIQNVVQDQELLTASSDAEKQFNVYMINTYMRRDFYKLAKSVYKKEKARLAGEDLLFITHLIETFERNGLRLDEEKYAEVRKLNGELTELCTEFSMNIAKDNSTLTLTREELDGLPESFIESLEQDSNSNYIITTKYPHVNPIYEKATSAEVRKKVELLCGSRCPENIPILFNILTLRRQIAELLGYSSWAEYALEINMAKRVDAVDKFLMELAEKLKPLRNKELDYMMKEKQGMVESYDWRYYVEKEKLDKYNINSDVIREYFPLEHILKNMFEYFGGLLGLTFKETKSNCWHPDVREFFVYNADVYYESKTGSEHYGVNSRAGAKKDKSTSDQSSIPIGKVYFDLFPRPNKFTHAACFPLKFSTKADPFAVCAIVCNFTPATDAQTALLTHDEVETFYHEFGHAMHGICSSTYYLEFSGTQTDRDFVEMPSQMVENWCWEFNTLKRLGKHYKTGDPISDDMIAKLIATRYVGSGLFNCRQLCFAMSDILLHTRYIESEKDMLRIYDTLMEEVLGIPNLIGTHRLSTFGHIAGGYDAQYYGYMWSKVYADDIYLHIKHGAGMENNHSGHSIFNKQYRAILEAGGSVDAFKSIKRFLGREPSTEAFLHNLGL